MSIKNPSKYNQLIPAVYLLFEKDDDVLLLRRANTGYEDGKYSVVAGHVEQDEHCIAAAIREAKEEVGVVVHEQDVEFVHVMHRVSDQDRVDFYFLVREWECEIKNMEPHKCDALDWYAWDALPKDEIIDCVYQALTAVREKRYFSESLT